MEIVYLLPEQAQAPPRPFRTGEAGCVWLCADGALERDTRVRLSANSTHALLGHGVVDSLNELTYLTSMASRGGLAVWMRI